MYRKLLVPTDFSPSSEAALTHALRCREAGARTLVLLHVLDPRDVASLGLIGMEAYEDSLWKEMHEEARRRLEALAERCREMEVLVRLREGKPFAEIIRAALDEGVDAIVIGSHGESAAEEVLLGSTCEKVVRKAPMTVMVVKPEAVRERLLRFWKALGGS